MSQKCKSLCLDCIPICLMYSPEQRVRERKQVTDCGMCWRGKMEPRSKNRYWGISDVSYTVGVNAKSRRFDYQAVQNWRQITTEEAWFGTQALNLKGKHWHIQWWLCLTPLISPHTDSQSSRMLYQVASPTLHFITHRLCQKDKHLEDARGPSCFQ